MQTDGKCGTNALYLIILLVALINSKQLLYPMTTKLGICSSETYYWFYFYARDSGVSKKVLSKCWNQQLLKAEFSQTVTTLSLTLFLHHSGYLDMSLSGQSLLVHKV